MTGSAPCSTRAADHRAQRGVWWIVAGLALLAWDPNAEARSPKIALGTIAALAACAVLAYRRTPIEHSPGLAWATAWVALRALSLGWGSRAGAEQVSALLAALCVALALHASIPRDRLEQQLAWLGSSLGVAASVIATAEWLSGARGSAVHATMGNPNWLGLMIAPCAMLSCSGWSLRQRREQLLVAAGLGVQLWGLWLAQSRTAYVACAVAGMLALVRRRWSLRFAVVVVALACFVPLLAAIGANPPTERGDWISAVAGRRFLWRACVDAALAHFPAGTGIGGFGSAFLRAQGALLGHLDLGAAARAFQNPSTAHSDWLQAFVEQGVIGVVLLAGWLATSIRGAWTAGRAALVAIAVSAIADSPLEQPATLAIALWITAAAGVPSQRPNGARGLPAWCWLPLVALLGLATRVSLGTWLAERTATAAEDHPERRSELLARARAIDPYSPSIAVEYAAALLDRGEPELALQHADASLRLSESVAAELARAKALSLLDRRLDARRALERALTLDPASFRAHLGLAALELTLGNTDAAQAALGRAHRLMPSDSRLQPLEERIRARIRARETESP